MLTKFPAEALIFKLPLVEVSSFVVPLRVTLPTVAFDAVIVLPTPTPPVTTSAPDVGPVESVALAIFT